MNQAPVCWTDSAARASHCSTATWWTFRRRPADVRRSGAVAPEDAGLFSSPSRMPCGTSTRRSRGPASSLQLGRHIQFADLSVEKFRKMASIRRWSPSASAGMRGGSVARTSSGGPIAVSARGSARRRGPGHRLGEAGQSGRGRAPGLQTVLVGRARCDRLRRRPALSTLRV